MAKCKKCNADIDEKWSFCPKCGAAVTRAVAIPFRININNNDFEDFGDFDEIFEQTFKEVDKMFKSFGFPGELNLTIRTEGKPAVKKQIPLKKTEHALIKTEQQKQPSLEQRHIKQVEEPETKMERSPSGLNIELQLPGVGAIKNVSIKKLEESIEIKAYAGDKMYFKVIPISPDADISEKKFANDVLTIKIKK
jgi:hypothetical protein